MLILILIIYFVLIRDNLGRFVKGFYEAEGSIHKQKDNIIVIQIYNTNLELLKLTKNSLAKFGLMFNLNGPYKNNGLGGSNSKPIYRIQTGSRATVSNFLRLIKPSVKLAAKTS